MRALALLALLAPVPALAAGQAVGIDVFASDDADDTTVLRTGLTYDFSFEDLEHYQGVKVEYMRARPSGGEWRKDERIYYRTAGTALDWKWNAQVGTDGDTVLGNASLVREGAVRQEYFVEREILETPLGLEGRYHTLVGGAWDFALDPGGNHHLVAMAGAQDFDGDNLRTHLRGRYIAMLNPDWGLTGQLRVRGFHDSDPHELDYYSPRWFAEVVPVLQVRRFHGGWIYSAAAGVGWQRDADTGSRTARLVEASVTSPREGRDWYLRATATYTNTPTTAGGSYGYRQIMFELVRVF